MKLAVCALLYNERGEILGVSRRNRPSDMNLPGGKVDPGETPKEACEREIFEETGLKISNLELVYRAPCIGGDTDYDTHTYTAKFEGVPEAKEPGFVVKWVPWGEILGTNTFAAYNRGLLAELQRKGLQP
jgi:8-oxo-dGTP pyrophosphatase MutT (NUDIX family)